MKLTRRSLFAAVAGASVAAAVTTVPASPQTIIEGAALRYDFDARAWCIERFPTIKVPLGASGEVWIGGLHFEWKDGLLVYNEAAQIGRYTAARELKRGAEVLHVSNYGLVMQPGTFVNEPRRIGPVWVPDVGPAWTGSLRRYQWAGCSCAQQEKARTEQLETSG